MFLRIPNFLYTWQPLMGALIGAALPISFWFFIQWYQGCKKRKENLYQLEKLFVVNINGVVDIHQNIKRFLEEKLSDLISNIDKKDLPNSYSIATAFFPLFFVPTINESFLDIKTGSGYLDNKILQLIKMSKDFSLSIDDLRGQFEHTLITNQWVAVNRLNKPKLQKKEYKENLERFEETARRELIEKNIKTYLKFLISARVIVNEIRDSGIIRWRLKFTSSFKYFRSRKIWKDYVNKTFDRIDNYLEEKTQKQYEEILKKLEEEHSKNSE